MKMMTAKREDVIRPYVPNANVATTIPTSPLGAIPTPTMAADFGPSFQAPIPHPMNLVSSAMIVTPIASMSVS